MLGCGGTCLRTLVSARSNLSGAQSSCPPGQVSEPGAICHNSHLDLEIVFGQQSTPSTRDSAIVYREHRP